MNTDGSLTKENPRKPSLENTKGKDPEWVEGDAPDKPGIYVVRCLQPWSGKSFLCFGDWDGHSWLRSRQVLAVAGPFAGAIEAGDFMSRNESRTG